ncbi:MAG: hypothetical protein EPO35_05660 [Acidobacteria bacterium]|nr:MAG: hypothetical protein EPO35_05660 [Acidobacteriota bacterium]
MVPPARRQLSTLARAFLARFFENEAAGTTTDAREGFFWLIAALATPGIFLPLWMYFRWEAVAELGGPAALHRTLLFDKTIYLGVSTVGIVLLSAMIWHTLIVERRDALILGALPVRGRTITFAKLIALAGYIGMISIGMHAISALLYGFGLSSIERWALLLRFGAGQMIASIALNCFVFAAIVGLQNLAIAVLGPRRFARASSLLQVIVVGLGVGVLLLVPAMVTSAPLLTVAPAPLDRAIFWAPPMWFLGLNEVITGTSFAAMTPLAERAVSALALAGGVALIAFPIAASRTMAAAVEGNVSTEGRGFGAVSIWLTRALAFTPERRGVLQFTMAALARTHQQRLILAVTVGVAIAMVTPAAVMFLDGSNVNAWRVTNWGQAAPVSLLAGPLMWNFITVLGMRAAMAFPSELGASWLFAVAPAPMFVGRNAARSLLTVIGVVLPLALALPVWYSVWPWFYVTPVAIAATLGMLTIVDAALWGFVGIPCAKPLATQRSGLTSRWPGLLIFLYFYCYVFPQWQIAATQRPGWWFMLIPPTLIFIAVHSGSKSAARANGLSGDPHGYLKLDLSVSAKQLRSAPHA